MELYTGCPVQFALQFLAGKWRIGLIWNMREKSVRFGHFRELLPGITDKVLLSELDYLVTKGLVEKKQYKEFPPRTEYNLSETGHSLIPVIQQIITWGYTHLQDEKLHKDHFLTPSEAIAEIETMVGI